MLALCDVLDARHAEQHAAALSHLNDAFQRDPAAIHALVCNRVPCNDALMQHPTVVVQGSRVGVPGYSIGALGLVNGVLTAAGLPRVAAKFTDGPSSQFLGFCAVGPDKEVG